MRRRREDESKQTFKSAARVATALRRVTRLLDFNYKRTLRTLLNNASNFKIDKTPFVKASRVVFPAQISSIQLDSRQRTGSFSSVRRFFSYFSFQLSRVLCEDLLYKI